MRALVWAFYLAVRGSIARPYEVVTVIAASMSVALVVLVFIGQRDGLTKVLENAGSEATLILLGTGSDNEVTSSFTVRELDTIGSVVTDVAGDAVISPEGFSNMRMSTEGESARVVAVRGVTEAAFRMRRALTIVAGKRFDPGRREVIVGRELASRYSWLRIGGTVTIGDADWVVAGIFSAAETVAESELWAPLESLQDAYGRRGSLQSLRIGLRDAASAQAVRERLAMDDIRLALSAQDERTYYARQIRELQRFIDFIAIPGVVVVMAASASAALKSLLAMVESRRRETATLRAIGFSGRAAAFGVFAQAMALTIAGALIGIGLAAALFSQVKAAMVSNVTFSEVFFTLSIDAKAALAALVAALLVALVGGLPPAVVTARRSIVAALRKE
jgi:putative ABC transport system permease protein